MQQQRSSRPRRSAAWAHAWKVICCLKRAILGIPVCLVLILIGYDWYAFHFIFLGFGKVLYDIQTWFLILMFNTSMALLLTSYLRCVFTSSAVRHNPQLGTRDVDLKLIDGSLGEGSSGTDEEGGYEAFPRCRKCSQLKPRRAHHCMVCGECILKMDHHCPWVGNCVGLRNYKFFLLFLFYAITTIAVYALKALPIVYEMFMGKRTRRAPTLGPVVAITVVITLSFGVSLFFFLGFHLMLVLMAKTTIELAETSGSRSPYNMGWRRNWEAVFGPSQIMWLIPIDTCPENGYDYVATSADSHVPTYH